LQGAEDDVDKGVTPKKNLERSIQVPHTAGKKVTRERFIGNEKQPREWPVDRQPGKEQEGKSLRRDYPACL